MGAKILILGGTAEASSLARAVAEAGLEGLYSYAGRVADPRPQPLPIRLGGFGGPDGLAEFIREEDITHLIDATHPFAAQMSRNAAMAAEETGVEFLTLSRAAWEAQPGDDWIHVPDLASAAGALGESPRRVFLGIGRQGLDAFAGAPEHFYLLRLVDPPEGVLPFPDVAVEVARGPFALAEDLSLLQRHRIEIVVSKNSGGEGARAKIDAARELGLPVIMVDRPPRLAGTEVHDVDAAMDWLAHAGTDLGV